MMTKIVWGLTTIKKANKITSVQLVVLSHKSCGSKMQKVKSDATNVAKNLML